MNKSWFFENFSDVPDDFFDDAIGNFDLSSGDVELQDDGEDWEAKFQHLEPPPCNALFDFSSEFADSGNCNETLKLNNTSLLSIPVDNRTNLFPWLDYPVSLPWDLTKNHELDVESSQPKQLPTSAEMLSSRSFPLLCYSPEKKHSHPFRTTSPVSVLESSGSSSSVENLKFYCASQVPPKRPRSKCHRPPRRTFHPISTCAFKNSYHVATCESESESQIDDHLSSSKKKEKKQRNLTLLSSKVETKQLSLKKPVQTRQCSHCAVTSTPQWREGPNGPKTLCNACGVRFRSGRLLPEYRPAASPTFVPSLHSNSHRKVLEMRMTNQPTAMPAVDSLKLPSATYGKMATTIDAMLPMAPEYSF